MFLALRRRAGDRRRAFFDVTGCNKGSPFSFGSAFDDKVTLVTFLLLSAFAAMAHEEWISDLLNCEAVEEYQFRRSGASATKSAQNFVTEFSFYYDRHQTRPLRGFKVPFPPPSRSSQCHKSFIEARIRSLS